MADKKISALTSLAQGDVAVSSDVLPIVDTSATETKKATPAAIVGAAAAAGLTNVDINSGAIDGTTIGANSAAAGTFTTATATTGNITTVNATTVDTTNIEVTTIKAKDGTAAGSIADSTGVVTLASSVLTTTDINGGTIDGTPIGGSTAAAGSFTTLTSSSTVTMNGGTANGVLFLNGSKVATSGSALTFDGTYLTANGLRLAGTDLTNTIYQASGGLGISTGSASGITFYTNLAQRYQIDATGVSVWSVAGSEQARLNSTGLGIGTSSPSQKLEVANGDASIYGVRVGRGAGAVATNTAVGASALASNASGSSNTAIGSNAGQNITTGVANTLLGHTAGAAVTTGQITALGYAALTTNTTASANTGVGVAALRFNTTGTQNTALGDSALYHNTTASNNTAVGYQAGFSNTTGIENSAFGSSALFSNTTGVNNAAFGRRALYHATTSSANAAFGDTALYLNTTGANNTGLGYQALFSNTTASFNTAVGYQAMYSGTTADRSTAFGNGALYSVTTATGNQAFGERAGNNITTGATNLAVGQVALFSTTTGSYNTALGNSALQSNTTASNNTAVGYQALDANTTGARNTAVGDNALGAVTTGDNNLGVGRSAGLALTTGVNNTFVGAYNGSTGGSGETITTGSKNTILGSYNGNQGGLDIRTASNYIVLSDGDGNPRQVIDSSGNLGIGTSSPAYRLEVAVGTSGQQSIANFRTADSTAANNAGIQIFATPSSTAVNRNVSLVWDADGANASGGDYFYIQKNGNSGTVEFNQFSNAAMTFLTNNTERARITSDGNFLVGSTSYDSALKGILLSGSGILYATADGAGPATFNRLTNDGDLIGFQQASTLEGTISVSGATVSYNAFAGSHWSQLQDGSKPDILRGTVMESINELCVWPGEQNERLPKSKISDTAGSKKVYGVFMAWDNDWTTTNDMYVTAVGAFICRVNGSVTVQEGDLLESNGDGTARVQADDIIRSSTIGKVTSTVKTHEYDDGSYCVPTVLYCG